MDDPYNNCECPVCSELREMSRKVEARLLLLDKSRRIIIPDFDEWVGIGLLERDDMLPSRNLELKPRKEN